MARVADFTCVQSHHISSDFLMRSMLPLKERSRPVGCDFTQTQCDESPYCILCFFWAPAMAAAGGIGALPRCFGLTLSDCHFHHMRKVLLDFWIFDRSFGGWA